MNKNVTHSNVKTDLVENKKHVTMNTEPEVFTIRPDTLEVQRLERPKSIHFSFEELSLEELTAEELANLVEETADIIRFCEEKVMNQKLDSAKLGFMLIKITEGLQEYETYLRLLNSFLVNEAEVTAQYFIDVYENLPPYGDYLSTIDSVADSKVTVEGIEGPVEKSDLKDFVKNIQDNAYNWGISLKSFRGTNKVINDYMRERRQINDHISKQIGLWLDIKNSMMESLDGLRDRLYKLSAHLNFVKSGETKIKPALDITSSSFGDSSTYSRNSSLRATFGESSMNYGYSGLMFGDSSKSSSNNSYNPSFEESTFSPEASSLRSMLKEISMPSEYSSLMFVDRFDSKTRP